MKNFSLLLDSGEDIEIEVTDDDAYVIRAGFDAGNPFSIIDKDGDWHWINPERITMAFVGE